MSITLDEFIESITTSGLMDAEEIQSFLDTLPMERRPTTAEDLAKELYRQGKLLLPLPIKVSPRAGR